MHLLSYMRDFLHSYDRAINLAFGLGMCFVLANVGHGAYQLANGVGKKDGF